MCDTGRTACAAVTSIFQHKACCFKECNRGRPPPQALSELDHHVNSDVAWVAAAAHAALACWLPPEGLWPSLTTTLANGASTETNTHTHTHKNAIKSTHTHCHPASAQVSSSYVVFVIKATLCNGDKTGASAEEDLLYLHQ